MWTFKRTCQEVFDTGGLLLIGLGCLNLFRQQYYPNVLGPLSLGMISVGALGFVRHLVKDLGSGNENSQYQEILLLLQQRQSEIEANRCMLEELKDSCSRFMTMREILEVFQGDPSLIEERAAILAEILQPRDILTSRESIEEATSDVQIEPLAEGSSRESENRALSGDDVGRMKFDVQPEQIGRNPNTLKEQVLQIQSNISATLQCHATENLQMAEIKKEYLETNDESKQEDPENFREKVTEKDIMKQDGVLKDMDKTGEENAECKVEKIKNLSKNVVQLEEKEVLSEDVDEMKLDVQKEQIGRSPKTLKEQALQVQSNISASLQCHEIDNHQKEETKKQYLEINDESKQKDPENICEKVTEKDTKQEDGVLKDMGKTIEDGVECNPEEIKNLSKNDTQPEEKEEHQKKESDKLNPQDERSEDIASQENANG